MLNWVSNSNSKILIPIPKFRFQFQKKSFAKQDMNHEIHMLFADNLHFDAELDVEFQLQSSPIWFNLVQTGLNWSKLDHKKIAK